MGFPMEISSFSSPSFTPRLPLPNGASFSPPKAAGVQWSCQKTPSFDADREENASLHSSKLCRARAGAAERRINGRSPPGGDSEKAKMLRSSDVYPIMRTYQNDLGVLVLVGDADPSQVLEAMATDGGLTAAEDIAAGRAISAIETLVPGHIHERSSIATKLLAPTDLVIQKAKLSWHKKPSSHYSRRVLRDAIARAFESVVMREGLKFELCIESPGSSWNMKSHPNERDAGARLESSDLNTLLGISEAMFSYMMVSLSQNFEEQSWIKQRFSWEKLQALPTVKPPFQLLPLSKREVSAYLDEKAKFSNLKETFRDDSVMESRSWWPMQRSMVLFILSKVCASQAWIYDNVPVHRLVVNLDVVTAEVQGGHKNGCVWGIQLTHSQLVDLANLLDLYYEDRYTCPQKRLPNEHNLVSQYPRSKGYIPLLFKTFLGFVGAFMLVGYFLSLQRGKLSLFSPLTTGDFRGFSTFIGSLAGIQPLTRVKSEALLVKTSNISPKKMEALCVLVTVMVKDNFNWAQDIESSVEKGVWMGKDLTGWSRNMSEDSTESDRSSKTKPSMSCSPNGSQIEKMQNMNGSTDDLEQNLLVFKVTISKAGKVIGIQPINQSAATSLTTYLLDKLLDKEIFSKPGITIPGLEELLPLEEDAVIELIILHDETSPSVSARPLHL